MRLHHRASGHTPAFAKVRAAVDTGDFKGPDVKKLNSGAHYRTERALVEHALERPRP